MKRFGEKLRCVRQFHKVTLKQLAQDLGYATHSYISQIESGQKIPTALFVLKVSRYFNVSTDELQKDELELNLKQSKIQKLQ